MYRRIADRYWWDGIYEVIRRAKPPFVCVRSRRYHPAIRDVRRPPYPKSAEIVCRNPAFWYIPYKLVVICGWPRVYLIFYHPRFFNSFFYIARIKAVGLSQNTVNIDLLFYLIKPCIEAECGFKSIKNVVCWSSWNLERPPVNSYFQGKTAWMNRLKFLLLRILRKMGQSRRSKH